jgi:hypothetical protein
MGESQALSDFAEPAKSEPRQTAKPVDAMPFSFSLFRVTLFCPIARVALFHECQVSQQVGSSGIAIQATMFFSSRWRTYQ